MRRLHQSTPVANGPHRRSYRPRLEALEDRITPIGDPLVQPPVLQSVNGVLRATLVEAVGPANVGDTQVVNGWTYNGSYVGPTLMVNPGDLIDITLVNQLPAGQTTNLHTHGLHVSPLGNSDNVLLEIEPGESNHYLIRIPSDHPMGLNWYHPHKHGTVNTQISLGLSGLLVIGRPDGGAPQLDTFGQTLLALKNALVSGNQINVAAPGSNVAAQTFTVNGQLQPVLQMSPGERRVFNVANIGNNAFYNLQLLKPDPPNPPIQLQLITVAEDGNPFTQVQTGTGLGMPPGRRWSFTFDTSMATSTDVWTLRTSGFNDGTNMWPAQTLMTITFTGTAPSPGPFPVLGALSPPNNYFHDLLNLPIAARREVVFGENGQIFTINGQQFPNNPIFQPRLNTVEEWVLRNPTMNDHPFHLHTNPQQVQKSGNNFNPTGLQQFQDVINVPAGRTVVIRMEYLDFLGEIVYHCHRVDHEDHGMMALVNILPETPTYATGSNPGNLSRVKVFNPANGSAVGNFLAFGRNFRGGVNVAVADVNADGVYDFIVGKTRGNSHIKVIDGTKLNQVDPTTGVILPSALLASFHAYSGRVTEGVFVAGADSNGAAGDTIIVGPGGGSRKVRTFDSTGQVMRGFYAFGSNWINGVRVAGGDIDGDGRIDIICGKGPGTAPRVKIFSGMDQSVLANFLAFHRNFQGGVFVASGNIKGYAYDDVIVGKGPGAEPLVRIFSNHISTEIGHQATGLNLMQTSGFLAYDAAFRGGVRVSSLHDVNLLTPFGSNRDDVVTTTSLGADDTHRVFARDIPLMP